MSVFALFFLGGCMMTEYEGRIIPTKNQDIFYNVSITVNKLTPDNAILNFNVDELGCVGRVGVIKQSTSGYTHAYKLIGTVPCENKLFVQFDVANGTQNVTDSKGRDYIFIFTSTNL